MIFVALACTLIAIDGDTLRCGRERITPRMLEDVVLAGDMASSVRGVSISSNM